MASRLETFLYSTPSGPPRVREKPMKVIALGMGRSGTESLSKALRIIGYNRVYHGFDMGNSNPPTWEQWVKLARRKWGGNGCTGGDTGILGTDLDAIIGDCEAVTGSQIAVLGREFINAYPDAKVILNVRDSDQWHRSACNTFGVLMSGLGYSMLPYFHPQLYWRKRYYEEMIQAYFHGSLADNGKWVYEEHCAKIRGLVHHEQLLEWQVQDGWEPLCRFLGREVPQQDFPHGNTPGQMIASVGNLYMEEWFRAAWFNLSCFMACGVGVVGVLAFSWWKIVY
ncbi:hypothetical protein BDV26DRAFT_288671 [Aspergillus bertholletiae]|uniref:P-loop containing nucleoside triphosphate hydrolase protein n=1 Tax=Aspergillus bertholletiae TaxID=1226010 RepID=A0A5N7BKV5_9EURO|nr:hypothetical protein BDV26DRAFT_288671 [Aspergillus bertholletiae]